MWSCDSVVYLWHVFRTPTIFRVRCTCKSPFCSFICHTWPCVHDVSENIWTRALIFGRLIEAEEEITSLIIQINFIRVIPLSVLTLYRDKHIVGGIVCYKHTFLVWLEEYCFFFLVLFSLLECGISFQLVCRQIEWQLKLNFLGKNKKEGRKKKIKHVTLMSFCIER